MSEPISLNASFSNTDPLVAEKLVLELIIIEGSEVSTEEDKTTVNFSINNDCDMNSQDFLDIERCINNAIDALEIKDYSLSCNYLVDCVTKTTRIISRNGVKKSISYADAFVGYSSITDEDLCAMIRESSCLDKLKEKLTVFWKENFEKDIKF